MTRPVVYAARVRQQLTDLYLWIAEQSGFPDWAEGFVSAIFDYCDGLAEFLGGPLGQSNDVFAWDAAGVNCKVVRGGVEPPTPRFSGTQFDANWAKYGELREITVAEAIVGWMDLDGAGRGLRACCRDVVIRPYRGGGSACRAVVHVERDHRTRRAV